MVSSFREVIRLNSVIRELAPVALNQRQESLHNQSALADVVISLCTAGADNQQVQVIGVEVFSTRISEVLYDDKFVKGSWKRAMPSIMS